jgi:hypothetical protein
MMTPPQEHTVAANTIHIAFPQTTVKPPLRNSLSLSLTTTAMEISTARTMVANKEAMMEVTRPKMATGWEARYSEEMKARNEKPAAMGCSTSTTSRAVRMRLARDGGRPMRASNSGGI